VYTGRLGINDLTFIVARQRSWLKFQGLMQLRVFKRVLKSLAGRRIDGAMATFCTDLPLTSDLAFVEDS
jgi:hypothetical protein